jgi:signal transduction histidine kinase/DNA-binding response OmpR family regulator
MKQWYSNLLSFGLVDGIHKMEKKRITLLNQFCVYWFLLELVLILDNWILFGFSALSTLMNLFDAILILGILGLQYHKKWILARILFFSLIMFSNFMFANYFLKGNLIELFYLIVPPMVLIFTDKKWVIYFALITSYLFFVIPNKFYHNYSEDIFGSYLQYFVLFLVIFLLVKFFKAINRKNEALLETQRNELKKINEFQSQFFINVSHELRTPITIIKGEIGELKDLNNTHDLYESLHHQIGKIIKITDDVLDLAKLRSSNIEMQLQPLELNEFIRNIQTSFQPAFDRKQVDISFTSNANEVFVSADRVFLERAISNLVLNALKYTDDGGQVDLLLNVDKNNATIEVKDNGIGIAIEDLDKIFDRFFQENNHINKAGGSGIGLSFAKEIVLKHKGEISVSSTKNEGSNFCVVLPLTKEIVLEKDNNIKEIKAIRSLLPTQDLKPSFKKVLLVEDSFELRNYLVKILKDFQCFEVGNGVEALDFLEKQQVDVIITDIMMPKMDGVTLVSTLKNKNNATPVLVLTAKSDIQTKLQLLKLGVVEYLNKPFEKEELLIRLDRIYTQHQEKIQFVTSNNISLEEKQVNESWVITVKNYIEKNISDKQLNQQDLAEFFNVSKSTFYRKIKMETGLSPNQFITEIKLLKAKELIEIKGYTRLKEVVAAVGFQHTHYFSKLYHKRFGQKPFD